MLITEFKENRLNSLPDELYLSLPEYVDVSDTEGKIVITEPD